MSEEVSRLKLASCRSPVPVVPIRPASSPSGRPRCISFLRIVNTASALPHPRAERPSRLSRQRFSVRPAACAHTHIES
jgi:hypothetical protein